jgi:hypothetical protein
MSDEKVVVSLLVQSAKHLKDGVSKQGKEWHLWLITDSAGKEMTTFWTRAQEFVGQEIKGVITPTVGKDKSGNPVIKSSFAPDPEWEKGSAPSLKPASSLLRDPIPAYVPENKSSSFAAAYSKDIVVAMITVGMVKTEDEAAIACLCFFNGFYAMITNPDGKPKAKSEYTSAEKDGVVECKPPDNPKSFTARENSDRMAAAVREGQMIFQGKVVENDEGREATGDAPPYNEN